MGSAHDLLHILAAPSDSILLETSSFNCKPAFNSTCPQNSVCIMGVCELLLLQFTINSGRGFVSNYLADMGVLPIKVWKWMVLQFLQFLKPNWKWKETTSWWSHRPSTVGGSLQNRNFHRYKTLKTAAFTLVLSAGMGLKMQRFVSVSTNELQLKSDTESLKDNKITIHNMPRIHYR